MKFGKRDIARMMDVLDNQPDDADLEDVAAAVLDAALALIQSKGKFTVVGQTRDNPTGDLIALGWYGTEKQAMADALRLTYSLSSHEEWRVAICPVHHGSATEYHRARKGGDATPGGSVFADQGTLEAACLGD